jgi:hypothetical protein
MSDLKWTYRNEGIEMMPKDAVILMIYGISANVAYSQSTTLLSKLITSSGVQ